MAYVNISNVGLQSFLEQPANQTIKWVVNFEAFPNPTVSWSKGRRDNIIRNTTFKYIIKVEPKRTVLEIKETELSDSGQYFLTISAGGEEDARNFTLRVRGK